LAITQRHQLTPDVEATELWSAVDRLIDRADNLEDLAAHGLHLLAARRWAMLGRDVSETLLETARGAGAVVLAATIALERAREAYDGSILLMKGLEIGERYPNAALRPLRDVDLLVDQPEQAQCALIDAGFEPVGEDDAYYADRHHLRPLYLPGLPIVVELHRHPQWVSWAAGPSPAELFSDAVASATGLPGVFAPSPAHHAAIVAAHSWSGTPLRRILDLLDLTLLAGEADQAELWETARKWQVEGVCKTLSDAAAAVLFDGPRMPWHVRMWAGDVFHVKERTVLSNHVRRIASAFSALPPRGAVAEAGRALGRTVKPAGDETWPSKLQRAGRAVHHAFQPVSRHTRGEHDRG
jgi:hypothetical protein